MLESQPDRHALDVARAAQEWAAPATVILFGSRATGRYRADSDIDLLVVADDNLRSAEIRAYHGARNYMQAHPPDLALEVVPMTWAKFRRCRQANQHIAGQAAKYGVMMRQEPPDDTPAAPDAYPDHWPETERRILNARKWLGTLEVMIGGELYTGHQEALGFAAQQAVENALKGWTSAYNAEGSFNYKHEIITLWHKVQELETYQEPTAAIAIQAVGELLDYTSYPDPDQPGMTLDWLTHYAAQYRYDGSTFPMTYEIAREIQEKIDQAVTAVIRHIYALSGVAESSR